VTEEKKKRASNVSGGKATADGGAWHDAITKHFLAWMIAEKPFHLSLGSSSPKYGKILSVHVESSQDKVDDVKLVCKNGYVVRFQLKTSGTFPKAPELPKSATTKAAEVKVASKANGKAKPKAKTSAVAEKKTAPLTKAFNQFLDEFLLDRKNDKSLFVFGTTDKGSTAVRTSLLELLNMFRPGTGTTSNVYPLLKTIPGAVTRSALTAFSWKAGAAPLSAKDHEARRAHGLADERYSALLFVVSVVEARLKDRELSMTWKEFVKFLSRCVVYASSIESEKRDRAHLLQSVLPEGKAEQGSALLDEIAPFMRTVCGGGVAEYRHVYSFLQSSGIFANPRAGISLSRLQHAFTPVFCCAAMAAFLQNGGQTHLENQKRNKYFSGRRQMLLKIAAELQSGNHVLLWGAVGTGKSALAAEIIGGLAYDLLTGSDPAEAARFSKNILVASHICSMRSAISTDIVAFVCRMAAQFDKLFSLPTSLVDAVEALGNSKSSDSALLTFLAVLRSLPRKLPDNLCSLKDVDQKRPALVVIDSLDESLLPTADSKTITVADLFLDVDVCKAVPPWLRFVFTARSGGDNDRSKLLPRFRCLVEEDLANEPEAVRGYLHKLFEDDDLKLPLSSAYREFSPDVDDKTAMEAAITAATEAAQNNFLVVTTLIRSIAFSNSSKVTFSTPCPRELGDLYKQFFEHRFGPAAGRTWRSARHVLAMLLSVESGNNQELEAISQYGTVAYNGCTSEDVAFALHLCRPFFDKNWILLHDSLKQWVVQEAVEHRMQLQRSRENVGLACALRLHSCLFDGNRRTSVCLQHLQMVLGFQVRSLPDASRSDPATRITTDNVLSLMASIVVMLPPDAATPLLADLAADVPHLRSKKMIDFLAQSALDFRATAAVAVLPCLFPPKSISRKLATYALQNSSSGDHFDFWKVFEDVDLKKAAFQTEDTDVVAYFMGDFKQLRDDEGRTPAQSYIQRCGGKRLPNLAAELNVDNFELVDKDGMNFVHYVMVYSKPDQVADFLSELGQPTFQLLCARDAHGCSPMHLFAAVHPTCLDTVKPSLDSDEYPVLLDLPGQGRAGNFTVKDVAGAFLLPKSEASAAVFQGDSCFPCRSAHRFFSIPLAPVAEVVQASQTEQGA
jgi:hypothetical protein